MALDPEIGLVGRDDIVALLETVVERRKRHPLPIMVVFGPGGSGKTSLLDHVRRRYGDAPIAKVDLDKAGSRSCTDILDRVAGHLRAFVYPGFGRLRLPRYALARLTLESALNGPDPHGRARQLAAQQLIGLAAATKAAVAVEVLPAGQGLARVIEPVLRWLVTLAVIAPSPLRRLLAGPRVASAMRWFENHVGGELMGEGRVRLDEAVVHTSVLRQSGEAGDQTKIDRLLVAAFLADLRAAYQRRGNRRMNCVLLLDGADLLDSAESYLPPQAPARTPQRGTDFLSLLAERRLAEPDADVPLLVIATKQQSPALLEIEPTYEAWRRRYGEDPSAVYLPVRLRPFELEHTRQFLAEWNRKNDSTVETEALVREIHEVTHGHPLAVRLAIKLFEYVYVRDLVVPSVRGLFDERLPASEPTALRDATVGEYLLLRFFQRIPGAEEVPERDNAMEVFARLAAPRALDLHTVRALLPSGWSAENMWNLLRELSFVQDMGDGHFVLHPLLRDLLARRLGEVPADHPFSYRRVHQLLMYWYEELGHHREALYHGVALGDVALAARRLRDSAQARNPHWFDDLMSVVGAPAPPAPPTERLARWQAFLQRLRPIVPNPEATKVAVAMDAIRRLYSSTSTVRRVPALYDRAVAGLEALDTQDGAREEHVLRLRQARRMMEDKTQATPASPLAPAAEAHGRHKIPRPRLERRTVRMAALTVVLLTLAGYLVVFWYQSSTQCLRHGLFEPWEVAADDSLTLSKRDDGECIGVSDRPGRFTYGDATLRNGDDAEVEELSRLIAEENRKVLAVPDREHVTIVVASIYSSRDTPKADLSAGVNELRGAYLAQRDWNQLDKTRPNPLVRLVLANLGGEVSYARDVARQIRAFADRDPTVVAVTGMGQSRAATVDAVGVLGPDKLGRRGIPIVASSPSSTDFTNKPYFFRTGPSNVRQAEVAAMMIERTQRLRDRPVFLVGNPADEYSKDLARAFGHLRPQLYEFDDSSASVTAKLRDIVADVCRRSDRALILYTGRAGEVSSLLGELSHRQCGDPVVLGGDELSQLETSKFADLHQVKKYADRRLYFTTFGWTAGASGVALPQPAQQFFAGYTDAQDRHGATAFGSGPNGQIMLAYDAVKLVARSAPAGATREDVFRALREARFDGASGMVDFTRPGPVDDQLGADPAHKLVVGQEVTLDEGRLTSSYVMHDGA